MAKKIFHITKQENWYKAKVKGQYDFCSLYTEGFIHCSTKDQYLKVANARFKNEDGLVLLAIDESAVTCEIKYENLEGGSENFPHIYGPLNVEAVMDVFELKTDETGEFDAPL